MKQKLKSNLIVRKHVIARAVRAALEPLETRILMVFTASAGSAQSIDLSYDSVAGQTLALEQFGPGDRSFHSVSGFTPNTSVGAHTFTVGGLTADTLYQFRLRVNANNHITYTTAAAVTSNSRTKVSLDQATNVTVSTGTGSNPTKLFYDWDPSHDPLEVERAAEGYGYGYFERVKAISDSIADPFGLNSPTWSTGHLVNGITVETDGPALANGTYQFAVEVSDSDAGGATGEGPARWSTPVALTVGGQVQPPAAPTAFSATTNLDGTATFSWSHAGTLPVGASFAIYGISTTNQAVLLGTAATPTLANVVIPSAVRQAFVVAGIPGKYSTYSNIVQVGSVAPASPSVPGNVTATAGLSSGGHPQVFVQWNNTANNELGYRVDRTLTSQPEGWVAVANMAADQSSYLDTYVGNNAYYNYRVVALGVANTFSTSTSSTVYIPPVVTPTVNIGGSSTATVNSPYTLTLNAQYPSGAAGAVQSWTIDWGDGLPGTPDIEKVYGSPSTVTHIYKNQGGAYQITASATDENNTYAASSGSAMTIVVAGGSNLTIAGPTTATIGSVVQLKAAGGNGTNPSIQPTYIWNVTLSGKVVATGSGATFSYAPSASGTMIATVTAIGDASGTSFAEHTLNVTIPEGKELSISGPDGLAVAHVSVFNFDADAVTALFGKQQVEAWHREAPKKPGGNTGPTFEWTVKNLNGSNQAQTVASSTGFVYYDNYDTYVSPALLFAPPSIGLYTISIEIKYNGKTYLRGSETLKAVTQPAVAVVSNVIPGASNSHLKGDSAVETGDGSILVVNQENTGTLNSSPWTISKFTPDLALDLTFGQSGHISAPPVLSSQIAKDYGYWDVRDAQIALQSDGKFLVATTIYSGVDADRANYYGSFGALQAAARWMIARYNPDGSLDTQTFGPLNQAASAHQGYIIDASAKLDYLETIALQPDGKILVAGAGFTPATSANNGGSGGRPCFLIKRFNHDGTIDSTFNGNGSANVTITPDGTFGISGAWGTESAGSLAVQSNGGIIVGGFTSLTNEALLTGENTPDIVSSKFALVRLNPNGTLDTTFGGTGSNGRVVTSFNGMSTGAISYKCALIRDIGIDPQGNIIAMGAAGEAEANRYGEFKARFAIAKYTPNGVLDTSFGTLGNGMVLSNFIGNEWAYAGTLTPSGDIVMAGQVPYEGIIAKFLNSGAVDSSFGLNGAQTFYVPTPGTTPPVASYANIFRNVIILRGKKNANDVLIVGSGSTNPAANLPFNRYLDNEVIIARYRPTQLRASNLVATATPAGPINLSWENSGTGEDGFQVFRSSSPNGLDATSVIATVGPDQTTYIDSAVAPNTTYYYRIVAFNTDSYGAVQSATPSFYSNIASAVTAPVNSGYVLLENVSVPISGTKVSSGTVLQAGVTYMLQATGNISQTLDGTHRGDSESGYYALNGVSQWWDKDPSFNKVGYDYGIGVSGTSTSTLNEGLNNKFPNWGLPATDSQRTYSVMVVGNGQPLELSYHDTYYPDNTLSNAGDIPLTVRILRALPSSPGNLTAAPDHAGRQITLNWNNYAADATSIVLQRAGADGNFTTIATLPPGVTTFSDPVPSISFNSQYIYRLIARSGTADSSPSNLTYAVLPNFTPQISAIQSQVAYSGSAYSYQVIASDPEDGRKGLTYSLAGLSNDIVIDSTTGIISWTPAANLTSGGGNGTVTVTDADGASSTIPITLVLGPSLTSLPTTDQLGVQVLNPTDTTVTLKVNATVPDAPNTPIFYKWTAIALPPEAGLPQFSADNSTGASQTVVTLNGAGDYVFQVTMDYIVDPDGRRSWPSFAKTGTIHVTQKASQVSVTPAQTLAQAGSTNKPHFTAAVTDQFGQPMKVVPAVDWSIVAPAPTTKGTIDTQGDYTPPATVPAGAPLQVTVQATVQNTTVSAFASINVSNSPLLAPVIDSGKPDATPLNFSQLELTASATDPRYPGTDSHLKYFWETVANPGNAPQPVFSENSTNAAKNTIATCSGSFPFNYTFKVTVTNDDNVSSWQTVMVTDDRAFAKIDLTPKQKSVGVSKTVQYTAAAQDQFGRPLANQPSFVWKINNVLQSATGGTFSYTPSSAGEFTVSVSATVNTVAQSANTTLTAIAAGPPVMQIVSPVASASGKLPVIAASTPVKIISDNFSGDAAPWQLFLVPPKAGTIDSNPIKLNESSNSIGNADGRAETAVMLDPSAYADGIYTLLLKDAAGNLKDSKSVQIQSTIKLGNLVLPFTDMTASLADGQTASVGRTYDSSKASVPGEMGYGWTFNLANAQLHTTFAPATSTNLYPALRDNDLVYLTLPNGEQHVFAFVPYAPLSTNQNDSDNLLGYLRTSNEYRPRFLAVDGSMAKLDVPVDGNGIPFRIIFADGQYHLLGFGTGYNPSNSTFGNQYTLTTADGTAYTINAKSGAYISSTDANGNSVTYTGTSALTVARDSSNRVTSVTAPSGQKVQYSYNAAGELASETSPTGEITQFWYDANHRLTRITDPKGVDVLKAGYDPNSGLLSSLANSLNNAAPVQTGGFDGVQASQTVADPLGNKSETIYDAQGNVARQIDTLTDALGKITGYRVTVSESLFFSQDKYSPMVTGVSLVNAPLQQTQYQPFVINGTDSAGLRYSQAPTLAVHQVLYDYAGGDMPSVSDPDLKMPIQEATYVGPSSDPTKNLYRVTQFSQYLLGKPKRVTQSLMAVGTLGWVNTLTNVTSDVTSTYDATSGNLTSTTDAVSGTTTSFTYTDGTGAYAGIPKGLPLNTYRQSSIASGGRVRVSSNDYYVPADIHTDTNPGLPGAFLGKLKSTTSYTTDSVSQTTVYAYDPAGNVVLTYTPKTWSKSDGTSVSGWTTNVTRYDLGGRSTDSYSAAYVGTGAAPTFTVSAATSTTVNSVTTNTSSNVSISNSVYDDATQASGGSALQTSHTAYNADGQVTDSTDAYGGVTHSTYDAAGHTIRVQNPDGTETRSVYDALGRVTWQTDRFVPTSSDPSSTANIANATHTLYDASGNAYKTERYTNVAVTIANDTTTGLPSGTLKSVAPASPGTALSSTQSWYDDQNRLIETKDAAGLRTGTIYDAGGQVAYSGVLKATAPDGGRYTTSNTTTNHITTIGFTTADLESSASTGYTSYLHNQANMSTVTTAGPTVENYALAGTATQSSTSFGGTASRANDGNTDGDYANNSVTATALTAQPWWQVDLGQVQAIGDIRLFNRSDAVSERLSDFYVMVSDTPFTSGDLATTLGQPGVWSYHVAGEAGASLTVPTGRTGRYVRVQLTGTNYLSLAEAQVLSMPQFSKTAYPLYDRTIDANGHHTDTYRSVDGRTNFTVFDDGSFTQTIQSNGDTAIPGHYTTGTTLPTLVAGGSESITIAQRKVGDPIKATIRVYDRSGNLTDVWQPKPDSATARPHWSYAYDVFGNETSRTDPKTHVTSFKYDENNQRVSRTMPPDSDSNTSNDTERWTFDRFGRTLAHADFKGQTTAYEYDPAASAGGRETAEYRFNSGATVFTSGVLQTSNAAERTVYGYDTLGRQNVVDEYSGTTQTRHVVTTFDPITGGVTSQTTPEGTIQYGYDHATGRERQIYAGNDSSVYGYDAQGRLTNVVVSPLNGQDINNLTISYAYDAVGNLVSMRNDEGTWDNTSDDVSETYTYDDLNRLDTLTAKRGNVNVFFDDYSYTSDGQKQDVLEKRYNASGTLTSTTRTGWTYDDVGHLKTEIRDEGDDATQNGGDFTDTYAFDLSGNRTGKTHDAVNPANDATTTSSYNDRDELTSSTTGGVTTSNTYDANGSTLTEGSTTAYTWDLRNRMASVTVSGVTTTYKYDENGVRISKTGGGHTTTFLNDALNPTGYAKPIEEFVDGNLTRSYVIGLDVLMQADANSQTTIVRDGRGYARTLINENGVATQAIDYDAFANPLGGVTPNTAMASSDGYRDIETGSYYQNARIRQDGRWKSEDNMFFGPGELSNANLFSFVGSDPVNDWDPSGHASPPAARLGTAVHKAIAENFTKKFGTFGVSGPGIFTILQNVKAINPGLANTIGSLFPDLVYLPNKEVFEIKPNNYRQVAIGIVQLIGYVAAFNALDPTKGWNLGSAQTYMPPPILVLPEAGAIVLVSPPVAGMILYTTLNKFVVDRAENKAQAESARFEESLGISTIIGLLGGL